MKSTHPRPHETDETTSTGAPSTSGIRGTDRGCAQPACRPRAPFGYDAGVLFSRPVVCTVSDAAVQVSPVPECPRTAEELGLNVELDRQVSGPAAGARGAWGTRPAGEGRRASSSPPRALRLDHGLGVVQSTSLHLFAHFESKPGGGDIKRQAWRGRL